MEQLTLKLDRWKVIHAECGEIAFYTTRKLVDDLPVYTEDVELLDGSHPEAGDPIVCGHCKKRMSMAFMDYEKDIQKVELH